MRIASTRLKIGGLAAATIMSLTAAVPPLSLTWVNQAREDRERVEDRLSSVQRVLELLVDAETGQRGYVITGKDIFLQPYHAALAALPAELALIKQRYVGDHAREQALVAELLKGADTRVAGLAEVVLLRQNEGMAAAQEVVSNGHGKQAMDHIRAVTAELASIEAHEMSALDSALRAKIWSAILFSTASTVLTLALLMYLARMMLRTMRAGQAAADAAQRTSEQLEAGMEALRSRNEEISTLGEMSRVLHTEMLLVEALEVTSAFCGRLLPGTSGSIYLFRNSADLLELAAHWGDAGPGLPTMEPGSCWGLRRGQVHQSLNAGRLRCRHCGPQEGSDDHHVCVPLIAYGDVLGLLHVRVAASAGDPRVALDRVTAMAQTISEQVSLSLSNAKLRQVLRDQSIKDPLTGLYNRRFMEETLAKEMARARRIGQPLSLVVVDLDHFKKINDTHGHPTGDAVLRAAARQMGSMVRASDVACRFGGEEFVLILPDCTKEDALLKAQDMCNALRALALSEDGRAIPVTASFGVASSAQDGEEPSLLLEAADRAVYAAKRAGRDRVVAAGVPAEPAVLI